MSVIEIKDRDDLRVGDVATFAYRCHEFTGPLWLWGTKDLGIGSTRVRMGDAWHPDLTFVRATRKVPDLPTEPGSVILVTECRGKRVDEPVVAVRVDGDWVTGVDTFDGCLWHLPEHITEWVAAVVVPA